MPPFQLILFLYYCLAFWFGGIQVDKGNITFEDMVKVRNRICLLLLSDSQKVPDI